MIVEKCNLSQRNIQEVRTIPTSPDGFDGWRDTRRYFASQLPRLGGKYEYESRGIQLKPFPHDTLGLFQNTGTIIAYGILLKNCSGYYQFDPASIFNIAPITSEELRKINFDPNFKRLCQSKLYLCNSKEELDPKCLHRLLVLLKRKRSAYLGKRGTP